MGDLASLKAFAVVIPGRASATSPGANRRGASSSPSSRELGAGYVSLRLPRDAMGFLIIIVVLLFRPTGLFARAERIG